MTESSSIPLEAEESGALASKKLKTSDLISAEKAVRMLEKYWGGRPATKQRLIDLVKDRYLKAYARYHWTTTSKNLPAEWKKGPPDGAIEKKHIKPGVLTGSRVLHEDMKRWKWRKGQFHVTHVKHGGKIVRYFYRGVRFERAAIDKLLAEAKAVTRDLHQGGRKLDENRWTEFWVQVVMLARAGKLADPQVKAGVLSKLVIDAYSATGPSEPLSDSAIAEPLRKVREAMKASDRNYTESDQQPIN